jgi:hypothetical protein
MVVLLREIAARLLGEKSLVSSKVLYDAFHCGDSLAPEDLEPLSKELLNLKMPLKQKFKASRRECSICCKSL